MKKQVITLLLILAGFAPTYAQSYPEMITVEGGTFTMGDTKMESFSVNFTFDEHITFKVNIKTFKIAKTETTVAQWRAFCSATSRAMPKAPSWGWIDSHPIVNVSYNDAMAYCEWLSEKMDAYYRLPTEAEWEFAARGGNKSQNFTYSGSNDVDQVAWYNDNAGGKTQPVERKKANELGIYDMSGNVWEWCKDYWGNYSSAAQTNPKGPTRGTLRVTRGGCGWLSYYSCNVTERSLDDPANRDKDLGFRVVLAQ